MVEKVLIQYRRVTDSQPPSHVAVASTRYAYLRRAVKSVLVGFAADFCSDCCLGRRPMVAAVDSAFGFYRA